MRVRENLALQVAMILFVGVIAVLTISTYVFYQMLQTERAAAARLRDEVARLQREQTSTETETQTLKQIVSGHPEASLKGIRLDHAIDVVDVFPRDEALDTASYQDMVAHLIQSIRNAAARELAALERERKQDHEIERQRRLNDERLDQYRLAHVDLSQELDSARQRLRESREQNVERWRTLVDQLGEKAALLADWELRHHRLQQTLNRELAGVQRRYELMRERWEESLPDKEFAAPLGIVKHVDGRSRTLTVKVDGADLLPAGISMSVFAGPTDNVAGKRPKAKIEVIRTIGERTAEARIVEDRISDVILPDDVVYTTVWRPGQRLRFGLVGMLDIDGDGDEDLDEIRGLVEQSGGTIDAVVDSVGEQTGEISIETRYLVVGKIPGGEQAGDESVTAVGKIIKQADELGVDRMSLNKFLDLLGYVRKPASEQLSAGPRRRR